jgi:flagellar basal-body rod protein FlgB
MYREDAGGTMKTLFSMPINLTGKVMDMQLQRQNIIAGNIANVETPRYRPRELTFEKELQAALGLDAEGKLSLTSKAHMPTAFDPNTFGPEWDKELKPRVIHGEDRVNIDKEMARHAKNQLQYTALTQIMAKSFEGISSVIQDGKQV